DYIALIYNSVIPARAYTEYTISPVNIIFYIPNKILFKEVAIILLIVLTAAILLYRGLSAP
ncbi:hypothetical protein EDB80DRAFT_554805, partial [Ilyonectria destructans]